MPDRRHRKANALTREQREERFTTDGKPFDEALAAVLAGGRDDESKTDEGCRQVSEARQAHQNLASDRLRKLSAELASDPENRRWVKETRQMIRDGSLADRASDEDDVRRRISELRASSR